jgi:hypothetical protein
VNHDSSPLDINLMSAILKIMARYSNQDVNPDT